MNNQVATQSNYASMERPEPTFYTRIPKMAQLELDPYELALYTNYKQTASENGAAWKSNKTLAQETKMSIRKVQEARKSLETKGYIQSTYSTNENDSVTSPVTVTIVDIWEENHKRFSKENDAAHDGKPLHKVHTPMQEKHAPPAQGAYKEESVNKNQVVNKKDKDSAPAAQRVANPWYDAVQEVFGFVGGRNADYQKYLQGKADKKQFKGYELQKPLQSPEQLRAWHKDYKTKNPEINVVSSPAKLQSSIDNWQSKPATNHVRPITQRKAPANLALLEGVTA